MTDEQAPDPATILGRMVSARIDEDRARKHLDDGLVHMGGEVVTDPGAPAPWPGRWVVAGQ